MLSKLALRNTRKSFGDFAVYFLTLMFGVIAFYAFGSIDAQTALLDAESGMAEYVSLLSTMMDILSVIVAVVLAFLVVYANGFLIRRRKREFGTYLILGMTKRQVASILIMETLLVGFAALVVGLLLGVGASQGLSVLTASLFEIDMTQYRFVFSSASMLKTIGFFGILFAGVSLLNLLGFSRQTVSRLLHASKRSELRVRNPVLSMLLAVAGLAAVVVALATILDMGLVDSINSGAIWFQVAGGCVGTFMLFAGGSGLVLRVLQGSRNTYLRGLNPFVVRQLDAKMSSTYATMATVCITLFFAIVILAGGVSFGNVLNKQAEAGYDASFLHFGAEPPVNSMVAGIADLGLDLDTLGPFHEFTIYETDVNAVTLMGDEWLDNWGGDIGIEAIRETDANALLRMQSLPEIDLGESGFALIGPYGSTEDQLKRDYLEMRIEVGGRELRSVDDGLLDIVLSTDGAIVGIPSLVVPDDTVTTDRAWRTIINVLYTGDAKAAEAAVQAVAERRSYNDEDPFNYFSTKTEMHQEVLFAKAIVTFIGLYMGLILLVTSAAILALQQLSEATDNKDRYATLSKIGASDRMMTRAVRSQVAVYFGTPLVIALAYSLAGGRLTLEVIKLFGKVDVTTDYNYAIGAIALVYGGYFIATSIAARRIALER